MVSALSPAFDPATYVYAANVGSLMSNKSPSTLTAAAGATVTVVPADDDANTAGWQIPLADVQAGSQPSTTAVAVVVTAADTNTRLTYTVTVTREAPSAPTADHCGAARGVCAGDAQRQRTTALSEKSGVWRPGCQSIFEFVDPYGGPVAVSGNARFYRLDVDVLSDVAIQVASNTSRHIVLRSADGTQLEHVYYHIEYPERRLGLLWDAVRCRPGAGGDAAAGCVHHRDGAALQRQRPPTPFDCHRRGPEHPQRHAAAGGVERRRDVCGGVRLATRLLTSRSGRRRW